MRSLFQAVESPVSTLAFGLNEVAMTPWSSKSPALRDEGYMIDFFGSGYDVSERMGILANLERIHYQIPRLTFVDASGSPRNSPSTTLSSGNSSAVAISTSCGVTWSGS